MKNQRYLAQHDAATLYQLAEQRLRLDGADIDAAEQLSDIVATANRLQPTTRRKNTVALYASVSYASMLSGQAACITLVPPHEADGAAGKVSVLTPIGLALIGRCCDTTVDVHLPSGRIEKIRILEVRNDANLCRDSMA
ncbi:MAG: GreA/GreB family elongation factor [Oxalicibacterium faecigallinarum]|uniref:Transcription elongation factor GreA/GreB C-terminal domain-containing protein n=1 Tax=Oxalicibacterium faecigallinarum TaxID=573741 RepID=A0A8J3AQE6_9BURK|nr:GreA/GreB family elongation factor [Oxalicibacterium faecigallinarum]MDQ7970288.1 GreA/GreB family elongation factor [Oxalicibacterium faecigallinarum]GGI16809.1 hypothetical protein GCM10008066_05820 [Oxalicibacterium faecigallinarum]